MKAPYEYKKADVILALQENQLDLLYKILKIHPALRPYALFYALGHEKKEMVSHILSKYPEQAFAYDNDCFNIEAISWDGFPSGGFYAVEWATRLKLWDCVRQFVIIIKRNSMMAFPQRGSYKEYPYSIDEAMEKPVPPLVQSLIYSVKKGKNEIAELLIRAGADPNLCFYKYGERSSGLIEIAIAQNNVELIGILISGGATYDEALIKNTIFVEGWKHANQLIEKRESLLCLAIVLKAMTSGAIPFNLLTFECALSIFKQVNHQIGQNDIKSVLCKLNIFSAERYLTQVNKLLAESTWHGYLKPTYGKLAPLLTRLEVIMPKNSRILAKQKKIFREINSFVETLPIENLSESSEIKLLTSYGLISLPCKKHIEAQENWLLALFNLSKDYAIAKSIDIQHDLFEKAMTLMKRVSLGSSILSQIEILHKLLADSDAISNFLAGLLIQDDKTLAGMVFWHKWLTTKDFDRTLNRSLLYSIILSIPNIGLRARCFEQALGWNEDDQSESQITGSLYQTCHTEEVNFGFFALSFDDTLKKMEKALIEIKPELSCAKTLRFEPWHS